MNFIDIAGSAACQPFQSGLMIQHPLEIVRCEIVLSHYHEQQSRIDRTASFSHQHALYRGQAHRCTDRLPGVDGGRRTTSTKMYADKRQAASVVR